VGNDIYNIGRKPGIGWEYDITEDLILMKINNCTKCNMDKNKWKEAGENAETFKNEVVAPDEEDEVFNYCILFLNVRVY